jgi:hypothetical protein
MARNANALELILVRAGDKLSMVRLLKLVYLADLYAWRILGHSLSSFSYERYKHGPFDAKFYSAVEELLGTGRAQSEETTTKDGYDCTLVWSMAASSQGGFSRAEVYLVDLLVQKYSSIDLADLLAIVYATEPMQGAGIGTELPMAAQENKDRDAAGGISLETVLESRDALQKGQGVSIEDLKREILGAKA